MGACCSRAPSADRGRTTWKGPSRAPPAPWHRLPPVSLRPVEPGVILYPKPAGVTSHDVVARVRRRLGRDVKVGHAGALDPFATGLLLILLGRATRAQRFLMGLPKTYRAVSRLGWVSDTGDCDGELTETGRMPERL